MTKLDARDNVSGYSSKTLPQANEGKLIPEDRTAPEFQQQKKLAQQEVGTLMWVALKSRPDIYAAVSIAATHVANFPTEAVRLCTGIWRYLGGTVNAKMKNGKRNMADGLGRVDGAMKLDIFTDASFAPGGSKSRTGVVILLNGQLVHLGLK